MKVSVATTRRMITGLLLAQQIEAGSYDGLWDGEAKAAVVGKVGDKEEAAAA